MPSIEEARVPTLMAAPNTTSTTTPTTASTTASTTLDQIPKGQRVRVVATIGEEDSIARRLHDLGIRTGVEIEVIRRAPLGDPTVFELCGYQLCLRRSESSRVEVTTAAAIGTLAPAVPEAPDAPDARGTGTGHAGNAR